MQDEQSRLDELCINTIRTLAMDAVQKDSSGHPGTPMALARRKNWHPSALTPVL